MKKKTIVDRRYGNVLLESYKKTTDPDSPILGSFSVEGMAAENTVSQNETYYSTELWSMPAALGKGGIYIDEAGKLKPSTLFGSLDHPLTDDADAMLFRLENSAIAWEDIQRQENGTYNGKANILKTPSGNIIKTLLDYVKQYGGGDMLGVSSRGLGESQSVVEGYNKIVPESYELLAFDFVYNPSFRNKAVLSESTKNRRPLTEAIKKLAKEDKEHAEVYNEYAELLEKEVNMNKLFEESSVETAKKDYIKKLKEGIHKLNNAIYELDMMESEEFKEKYPNRSYDKAMAKLRKEKQELELHLDEVTGVKVESKKVVEESVNLSKHIWEGWTVGDFIEYLNPLFDQIITGKAIQEPFKNKEELKKWCMDNQPYYKKHIPEVVEYFYNKMININESIAEKKQTNINEASDLDDALEDFADDVNEFGDELPENEEDKDKDLPEDEDLEDKEDSKDDEEPKEVSLEDVYNKLDEVLTRLNDIEMLVSPVEDFESEIGEEELEEDEESLEDFEDLDLDIEDTEDEEFDLSLLTDEELEALATEELDYLKKNS